MQRVVAVYQQTPHQTMLLKPIVQLGSCNALALRRSPNSQRDKLSLLYRRC